MPLQGDNEVNEVVALPRGVDASSLFRRDDVCRRFRDHMVPAIAQSEQERRLAASRRASQHEPSRHQMAVSG